LSLSETASPGRSIVDFERLITHLEACFEPIRVRDYDGEFGIVANSDRQIARVGYATNLDPITATKAVDAGVDALITHHDAWDFLLELRPEAHRILSNAGISHCFVHLPLDAAPFGTTATLAKHLELEIGEPFAFFDGLPCGRVGLAASPILLEDVAARLRSSIGCDVRTWPYGSPQARRVGVTTGAGNVTNAMKEAADLRCDTYVTGESSLYSVQYARYRRINLVVGTHTQTELPGVKSLCDRLRDSTELEFVEIPEGDFESR